MNDSAPSCRSSASPKASVGVWLLVLIVFLPVVPVVLGRGSGGGHEWVFVGIC